MLTTRPRLPDPLIASVIFAPVVRNHTPSSVTASVGTSEAFEWMLEQDEDAIQQIFRGRQRDVVELKRFVSALCGQLELTATRGYAPAVSTSTALLQRVPARNFPFAGHFDLLALPVVEGISFDADDFIEH